MNNIPEQRREAQAQAMAGFPYGFMPDHIASIGVRDAKESLDTLLAYLDEHEPALADAIRYGLVQGPPNDGYEYIVRGEFFKINYPEGHEKR